jgi:hypothetical protein
MAKTTYLTPNKLTQQAKQDQTAHLLLILIPGIILTSILAFLQPMLALLSAVIVVKLILSTQSNAKIKAGAHDEDLALDLLKQLPDTYSLLNQVDLPDPNSKYGVREADMIVCGPNAIFVIEVKNQKGSIQRDDTSSVWKVTKTGRRGTAYQTTLRNPVKQVKHQVWLLSTFLKKKRIAAWIQPIVLFTHHHSSFVSTRDGEVAVLGPSELVRYISDYHPPIQAQGVAKEKPISRSHAMLHAARAVTAIGQLKTGSLP